MKTKSCFLFLFLFFSKNKHKLPTRLTKNERERIQIKKKLRKKITLIFHKNYQIKKSQNVLGTVICQQIDYLEEVEIFLET